MQAEVIPTGLQRRLVKHSLPLGGFGIEECRRVMDTPEGIAGIPQKTGIAQRFEEYLKKHEGNAGTDLLKRTYNYMLMEHSRSGRTGTRMDRKYCRRPIPHA